MTPLAFVDTETEPPPFAEWCIVELLGYRRIAGLVQEVRLAGAGMLRIDIPETDQPARTQYVNPGSVYALHPCSEDAARRAAAAFGGAAEPVQRWELEAAKPDGDAALAALADEPDYDGEGPF